MRFHFGVMVWGEAHREVYLKAAALSHFVNLTAIGDLSEARYYIYTTVADQEVLGRSPVVAAINTLVDIDWVIIDDQLGPSKWETVRWCHRHQVEAADAADAALFFICADQIWSRDSWRNALSWIHAGYDAVVCAGPRAQRESVMAELESSAPELTGRNLVRLLLDYPHQETRDWNWDSDNYFQYGSYIYFDAPGALIAFCYIMHPVVVKPRVKGAPFRKVFDQDWLAAACPDPERILVIQDSDEVCHIELSPALMELPSQPANPHLDPVQAMAWYAEACFNDHHRSFVYRPVCLHVGPLDHRFITQVVDLGRYVVNAVAAWLRVPDDDLLLIAPEQLERRISHRNWGREMSPADARLRARALSMIELHKHRAAWRPNVQR